MTELRTVAIDSETIAVIEAMGERLLRQQEPELAFKLLALCLGWKSAPASFHCDIDESAELADVVELRGYSRRVPGCA